MESGIENTEQAWSESATLASLKQLGIDELLGIGRRLVVVAPHPDDEILGCGGLIAAAAETGRDVMLISLTDGDAAYRDDDHWKPEVLAPARRLELVAAAHALGVPERCIIHLGYPDGELSRHRQDLALRLAAELKPTDVVLVTWRKDGHPDHEVAGETVARVMGDSSSSLWEYPIWAWNWAGPGTVSSFGADGVRFNLSSTALSAKANAIACLATQIGSCNPPPAKPVLPPDVLARFERGFETYLFPSQI